MKRFYLLWFYAVTLTALCAAAFQSLIEEKRQEDEAAARITAVATSTEESVIANYHARRTDRIARMVEKLRSKPDLLALAVCSLDPSRKPIASQSVVFPKGGGWESLCAEQLGKLPDLTHDQIWSTSHSSKRIQYLSHFLEGPVRAERTGSQPTLVLVLAQDLSALRGRWLASFARTFALTWLLGVALILLVALQARGWLRLHLKFLHHSLRSLVAGRTPAVLSNGVPEVAPDLVPLTRDIDKLHTKILRLSEAERVPRTNTAREETLWFARLREIMGNRKLTVVANREPYIHQRHEDRIDVVRPASGLVTALEPILRQCGGLWIAHGSGSADREVVDSNNEVRVPPNHPRYKLRRVWLTPEEESGYYYGFSNEGFWPLCHLAHNRPIFRLSDWEQYRNVNAKFADAIPDSSLKSDSLILVQDYHFALLPRMLRARAEKRGAPSPTTALFWHIPWPNAEAFGICPWNEELLRGMLGASVIGFHTQYHCNNFLESCNRYLEARIDYEHFTVTMENHVTEVKAFPIGIDTTPVRFLTDAEITSLKHKYGINVPYVAVGVDRLDYTKGLIERVEGVGRFLEKYPEYIGKFTLAQMGSPSRSQIPAYQHLSGQLAEAVNRVNERFGSETYQPILFIPQHHEWDEIRFFYQMGDVCMVTSLHDGMNLVAKEYVWCQRPDRGSLVLSKFTGASRELTDAFIINPYSAEELADSIYASLTLAPEERFRRMSAMREKVRAHNAFHWASDLIRATIKRQDESGVVIPIPERDRLGKSPSATVLGV